MEEGRTNVEEEFEGVAHGSVSGRRHCLLQKLNDAAFALSSYTQRSHLCYIGSGWMGG